MADDKEGKKALEDAKHARIKKQIEDDRDKEIQEILLKAGISEWAIGLMGAALFAIIALLLAPEPLISKALGILLGLGVGILTAYFLIKVFLVARDELRKAWARYQKKEDEEDDRYEKALKEIYGK